MIIVMPHFIVPMLWDIVDSMENNSLLDFELTSKQIDKITNQVRYYTKVSAFIKKLRIANSVYNQLAIQRRVM